MNLLKRLVFVFLGSGSLLASVDVQEVRLPSKPQGVFSQEIYDKLFNGFEETCISMRADRLKNAQKAAAHPPVIDDTYSFLQRGHQHTGASFFAAQQDYVDKVGCAWYIIDRNQSDVLRRTFASLIAPYEAADPFALENVEVVRSTAFEKPSRYGFMYTVRNNVDVGKPMLFQFILYRH
ncbi:MAG: hypothetical protein C0514_02380 [Candidatus Puniceispirillum sp.]|nr:hypothetical protein [Candidatus Puniceispirillum sp.]